MMDDVPTLTGRHLVRTFGDGDSQTTALNDVTMDLFRGQFALLMGPIEFWMAPFPPDTPRVLSSKSCVSSKIADQLRARMSVGSFDAY